MRRVKLALARGAMILVLAGCSKDPGGGKTDSAAADSIRDAHDAATADSASSAAATAAGSPAESVQGAINSTEGTIGETRKRVGTQVPDTALRDSVIHGPYKTMDSLGRIKR